MTGINVPIATISESASENKSASLPLHTMNSKKIIIITAPSGSGKTSITSHLLREFPQLTFSISATTRPPRKNEVDGKDYYFISEEAFRKKIEKDAFLEWEMVYAGRYYGTLQTEIERIWNEGKIPVLDIDVKGALNVRKKFPEKTLGIFIQVPSFSILEARLRKRGTEDNASIQMRLDKAAYEATYVDYFDAVVMNDVLETAQEVTEQLVRTFLEHKDSAGTS